MYKKIGVQALALGCVLLALGSCGSSKSSKSKSKKKSYHKQVQTRRNTAAIRTPLIADIHEKNAPVTQKIKDSMLSGDQKLHILATRLDEIGQQNVNESWGGKLPSYLHDSGFILGLDYLFLRADVEGMEYAYTQSTATTSTRNIDFGFDSGFRVGLGYTFGNKDNWDLMLDWTYFHNSASTSTQLPFAPDGTVLTNQTYMTSPWASDYLGDYISSASANWRLNYNVGDIELGRNFFIGRQLSVRPLLGFRAAWLYQGNKVNYTGYYGYDTTGILATLGTSQIKNQTNWHGFGLRSGADLRWNFVKCFALTGQISASLLYGRFAVRQDISGNAISAAGALTSLTTGIREGFNAVRPEVEGSLGFEFSTFFCKDQCRFAIGAAWEVQEWFALNELNRLYLFDNSSTLPITTGSRVAFNRQMNRVDGNLGIQGLRVNIRFDF